MFQSTHPGRGATKKGEAGAVIEGVSIHAPRAECDFTATFLQCCTSCFNPRTSGGVRHLSPAGKVGRVLFQSTHPGRGATSMLCVSRSASFSFNPRTPGGVRPEIQTHPDARKGVSIHAPRAGCDLGEVSRWRDQLVSIHAPRAGCDSALRKFPEVTCWFQSTHPGRGATSERPLHRAPRPVSIHAPRAGCDEDNRQG